MSAAREIADRLLRDLRAAGVSEHRARRGDLEVRQLRASVKGARHRDPSELHRLRRLGKIDGRQLAAGVRYYRDWYHSGFRALSWPSGPGDVVKTPGTVQPGTGPTGPEYLEACRVLAQRGGMIVEAVTRAIAIEGCTLTEAGGLMAPRTAATALRHGLDILAEHYGIG